MVWNIYIKRLLLQIDSLQIFYWDNFDKKKKKIS